MGLTESLTGAPPRYLDYFFEANDRKTSGIEPLKVIADRMMAEPERHWMIYGVLLTEWDKSQIPGRLRLLVKPEGFKLRTHKLDPRHAMTPGGGFEVWLEVLTVRV